MRYIVIENHPNDSRVKIIEDGICQSLTSRMGTGGGNVPIVIAIDGEDEVQGNDSRPSYSENK